MALGGASGAKMVQTTCIKGENIRREKYGSTTSKWHVAIRNYSMYPTNYIYLADKCLAPPPPLNDYIKYQLSISCQRVRYKRPGCAPVQAEVLMQDRNTTCI